VLVTGCGCAPATMSPMIIRMDPATAGQSTVMLGVRSGPYLSEPLSAGGGPANDANAFATSQWSPVSYDLSLTRRLNAVWAFHVGGQGAFAYPVPIPGYGLYAGVSALFRAGPFSFAPAVAARGATDFGIRSVGGPGSIVGGEATLTLALSPEPDLSIGLIPFAGIHQVWSDAGNDVAYYYGAVAAVTLKLGPNFLEVSGGAGRAVLPGTTSDGWTVPITGVRVGR
jgi:hypothetical protein